MNRQFLITRAGRKPHLSFAHSYWSSLVKKGDVVVDATAGNGHDTVVLANLALDGARGALYAIDIQEEALEKAKKKAIESLPGEVFARISWVHASHETFPIEIKERSVALFVYNLGYLPGGNKSLTTLTPSTLASLSRAIPLVASGGAICITSYPGHEEGACEEKAILEAIGSLSKEVWSVSFHRWINKPASPSVFVLQNIDVSDKL